MKIECDLVGDAEFDKSQFFCDTIFSTKCNQTTMQ